MSQAFIASVLQESIDCTGVAANQAAADLISAIVRELKKEGGFTLPSFGTFTVRKTKARKALNPRTGEPVKVKAGKTVRCKASPNLKTAVGNDRRTTETIARRAAGWGGRIRTSAWRSQSPLPYRLATPQCAAALF